MSDRQCECGNPITDSKYSRLCAGCYNGIEATFGDHHRVKEKREALEWAQWAKEQNSRGETFLYNL